MLFPSFYDHLTGTDHHMTDHMTDVLPVTRQATTTTTTLNHWRL